MSDSTMLNDQFGRKHDYLRIAITDSCNLRCMYCVPSRIECTSQSSLMSVDEIDYITSVFVKAGVKKIRLTGGEPLVRKDVSRIFRKLSSYSAELAITTNGIYIDKYIDTLVSSGVKSVNVSLDSLNPVNFFFITRKNSLQKVYSNIELLLSRNIYVKLNVVVLRGVNDEEILDFVNLTRSLPLHVRFIEFMPFSGNGWSKNKIFSCKEILSRISDSYSFEKLTDDPSDTAKKFQVNGFKGSFAVISSVSDPFCGTCNRIRITADGKLKNCLFSKSEVDLLGALRRGDDIVPLIRSGIWSKAKERGDWEMNAINSGRSMIRIGG